MKSHWLLATLWPAIPVYALQGTTPQAALEELATATRPEVIARHLPEPVQKRIEVLPKLQKQQVMEQLLEMKTTQLGGCSVRPAHDSEGWEILDEDGNSKGKVKLANAFISGVDALLPLELELSDGPQVFIVTMHLEDDEWRIDDFGPWAKNDLGLGRLLHQPTEMEKNEMAARETMNTLARAVQQYASSFPMIGYPFNLRILTTPMEAQNAYGRKEPLLDDSFAAEPLIRNGYIFQYLLTRVGGGYERGWGSYEITATPVEFGKTGGKNYLADPRLHVITQNRPATDEDPGPED
ncbi:MAG: hypothetical protein JWM08_2062 [Candidatus Angelobacter sp.]|nr:hypothetical protein [Candidatus Angelobacter sp.]